MRRWALFLVCLALNLDAFAEAEVRILSRSVVPARPYVGDIVEVRVSFDPGQTVPEPGPLPVPLVKTRDSDSELVEAAISRNGGQWTYLARFVAWKTGLVRVPLVKPAGLVFPDVMIEIASVVDDFGRDPPRYADPLELRGTRLLVWGVAGFFLVTALLAWSLVFWILPWLRRMRRMWREGQAARDFGRSLDYLEETAESLKADEIWALLTNGLRNYLSKRTSVPYRAYTAREAGMVAPETLPEGVAMEAAALLALGDEVRFARRASGADPRGAIERSRRILEAVEEAAHDGVR
jgi:hypothetical protein